MKNDYLWNKTGSDDDVQRLEDLLSGLRYVPVPAPEVKGSREKVWRRALIPAASAAVLAVTILWFAGAKSDQPTSTDVGAIVPVVERMPVVTTAPSEPTGDPRPVVTNAVYRVRKVARTKLRPSNPRPVAVTLTAEEKQAYEQVLLALYITGTQLKTVNDRINGIEDTTSLTQR